MDPNGMSKLNKGPSSSLKLLCQNEPKFGGFCIKALQSRIKGERHNSRQEKDNNRRKLPAAGF
jgi:hypothetical protein